MVYDGYLAFGGNEVINNSRAIGISRSASCPIPWLVSDECESLREALGDGPYEAQNIQAAPWYDPTRPESERFYGVFGLGFSGVKDSTRQVQVTEGLADGGAIGSIRKGVRSVRVRAAILARGRDALSYGRSWLEAALDPDACGQHGEECGTTDMAFFAACPPTRESTSEGFGEGSFGEGDFGGGDDTAWEEAVDAQRRFLHGAVTTSGPLTIQEFAREDAVGEVIEFTVTSMRPWVYGVTRTVDLPVTTPSIVEDIRYNLIPYPSMELDGGSTVILAQNYSTNPSSETNATGWSFGQSGVITAGQMSASRSTELAAVGTASYKVVFTSTTTGTGTMSALQTVALPSVPTGTRYSVNMWGAALATTGTPTLSSLSFSVDWLNASNTVLRTDAVGTAPAGGGAVTKSHILPPATATQARVYVTVAVSGIASGNVVNLFADALAVTIP